MTELGRWRLEREVGRGGAGVVWRAVDGDGCVVALKLLAPGARRFEREVRALAALRHPGLVSLLDSGEEAGRPFLVMQWVEGESLQARVERTGPLDPRVVSELGRRLALALEHCHARGVLHRDVKPGNVLIRTADGAPLLADFGLARELEPAPGQSRATREGLVLGTPGFAPPEQLRGDLAAVGPRSDLYGLGATLHFALTGQAPVAGATLAEVMVASERDPDPPSRLRPGIPPELDQVVARCLRADPVARPASAAELARLLTRGPFAQRRSPARWLALAIGLCALTWFGLRATTITRTGDEAEVARLLSSARTRAAAFAPLAELLAITSQAELAARDTRPLEDQVALARADLLARRGELGRALTVLEPLLARPGRIGLEAHWQSARALEGLGRFAETEALLARVEEVDPEGALGLAAAAAASQLLDVRSRAIYSARAWALEPANLHVIAVRALCANGSDAMLAAIAPLLEQRPDDPYTIELLADAASAEDDYPRAIRTPLSRLIQAEPRHRLVMVEMELAAEDGRPLPVTAGLVRFPDDPLFCAQSATAGDPGPLAAAFARDRSRTLARLVRLRGELVEGLLVAAGWEPALAPPPEVAPEPLRRALLRRARLAAPAARAALGEALLAAAQDATWEQIAPLLERARAAAPDDPVVALEAVRLLVARDRLRELDDALAWAASVLRDEVDRRELELRSALHEMRHTPRAGLARLEALALVRDPPGRRAALERANLLGERKRVVELASFHGLVDGDQPRLLAMHGRTTSLELPTLGAGLLERALELSGAMDLRVLGARCVVLFGWLRGKGRSVQPALDLLAAHMRRHPHSPSLASDAAILGSLFPGEAGEWSRRELADVDARVIVTAQLDRLLGSCELEVWGGSAEAVLARWLRAREVDGEGPGPTMVDRFRRRFGDRPELAQLNAPASTGRPR